MQLTAGLKKKLVVRSELSNDLAVCCLSLKFEAEERLTQESLEVRSLQQRDPPARALSSGAPSCHGFPWILQVPGAPAKDP